VARVWKREWQEDLHYEKIYTILAGSFMSLLSFAGNGYDDGKLSITYAGNDDIRISGWT
jgi:hypothetical protein